MDDPRMSGNMFDRQVPNGRPDSVFPLPLNLIALIISYLDRPSDLGRMCRTCRVFHYMTLPQLYSDVSLRSYDYIRYPESDGRPEGCGMGSPFAMGLNGLVSRSVSDYVKRFEVSGEWKEHELAEHAKVGRVPDGSMLLNSLVRVAVDKMAVLDEFRWELNSKMLPTVWQGLSRSSTLRKLTIRFPNKRDPRPMCLAPAMPTLTDLFVHDIDPLCYADDISLLLLGSTNIKHLKMHWSPRMRQSNEPSVHPAVYFGRLEAARTIMKLQSVAVSNFFAYKADKCGAVFDPSVLECITFLNSTSSLGDNGGTAFMDGEDWRSTPEWTMPNLRSFRVDKVSRPQCEFLANLAGLEKLYLVGPQARASGVTSAADSPVPLPRSPESGTLTSTPSSSTDCTSIIALKDAYLSTITSVHGPTLKHLLLLPQWRLTEDDVALLVRCCPNLEQLALGADMDTFNQLRILIPFLSKLSCVRILANPDDPTFIDLMREKDRSGGHMNKLQEETAGPQWNNLRFFEIGADDMTFEIGTRQKVMIQGENEGEVEEVWRRSAKKVPRGRVAHIPIWAMDSMDI